MISKTARRVTKVVRNIPNLWQGYNLYVNRDKLRLIDFTFGHVFPEAKSFADLGGVWKVNGAYALHTVKRSGVERGVLVDTNYPEGLKARLQRYPGLSVVEGDFSLAETAGVVGRVDVVYFFDVLLHQANPNWDEVLGLYAEFSPCFVIYNQQLIQGEDAVRLTDLPLDRCIELVSNLRYDTYKYIYEHKTELHPQYHKPWGDIHNVFQWGITDKALRATMTRLQYKEVFFRNYGRFLDLPAFENHAFIFRRS
jgi:hypothetical protein